jgi:hypothetical protein
MLNHKKRTNIDPVIMEGKKKKSDTQLKISDISRIEKIVDDDDAGKKVMSDVQNNITNITNLDPRSPGSGTTVSGTLGPGTVVSGTLDPGTMVSGTLDPGTVVSGTLGPVVSGTQGPVASGTPGPVQFMYTGSSRTLPNTATMVPGAMYCGSYGTLGYRNASLGTLGYRNASLGTVNQIPPPIAPETPVTRPVVTGGPGTGTGIPGIVGTWTDDRNLYLNKTNNPNYIINIHQTVDKDSIIVETNYTEKKFMFYDRNKNFLGGFSVQDFIKYITSNVSSGFLLGVDSDSVRIIIEKYICHVKLIDKPNKKYIINMLNYFESPFMGNIETLIKLYTFIHEFEENELHKELAGLDGSESAKILEIFNNMLYGLLIHILKIIAALTDKLSSSDNPKIKDSLLNYSVGIVYRLSKFIKQNIDMKVDELNALNQDMLRIEGIRTSLLLKLDSIEKSISKQNIEIDMILRNVIMHGMINSKSQPYPEHEPSTSGLIETRPDPVPDKGSELLEKTSERSQNPIPANHKPLPGSNNSSTSERMTSSLDKSHIYDFNSESGKNPPLYAHAGNNRGSGKLSIDRNNLGISELLDEVQKLTNNSSHELLARQKQKQEQEQGQATTSEKNKQSSKTQSSDNVANSLADILALHNKIDYNQESENSFRSETSGDSGEGSSMQIKYLSSINSGSTSNDMIHTIE